MTRPPPLPTTAAATPKTTTMMNGAQDASVSQAPGTFFQIKFFLFTLLIIITSIVHVWSTG